MAVPQITDEWSALSFIQWMGGESGEAPVESARYLPLSDQRRLRAYLILQSLMSNTRRSFLDMNKATPLRRFGQRPEVATSAADQFREYGDAMVLVEVLRDLILGESQDIIVGDPEAELAEGAVDPDQAVREWVEDWVQRERFEQKLLQGEEKTCGLGDVVYTLGVSQRAKRPKLRLFDPGMYFPDTETVVDGWDDDDFPPVVHMLWEYEDDRRQVWVRRITWAMVKLPAPVTAPWGGFREWTCMYTEVEWMRSNLISKATVYSQNMGKQPRVIIQPQDLLVDFIPVVHVPNTADTWGRSILTLVAQLLDDIQSQDSDLAVSAQTANPLLVTDANEPVVLRGMPGEQLNMREGQDAKYIAASLTGQIEFVNSLLARLAKNSRLGEVLLGVVSPADVPSGIAMSLGFHSARQVMRNGRRVREEKYPLIVKFAIRMAQAMKWLADGETPNIEIAFGSSLPSDLETAVTAIKDLLAAGAISTETAVTMLMDVGVPIDDATDEVGRIQAEDYEGMVKLVDALGSRGADEAARRLGLNPIPTPVPVTGEPPE